jgi:ketosteroid isomerase-like protein
MTCQRPKRRLFPPREAAVPPTHSAATVHGGCKIAALGHEMPYCVSDMRPHVRPRDSRQQTFGVKAVTQPAETAERQIKTLVEGWADAVRRHDLSSILAYHDEDIVMFDVPPPLQSKGMDEYKKTWDLFFKYHEPSQAFDIEELAITAGENVAFAVAIMRCGSGTFSGPPKEGGFLFRLTVGLRKVDGDWRIAHEHHSVPSTD